MVSLGPQCSDVIEWFGLTEWEIRTTCTQADARWLVPLRGGEVTLMIWEKAHSEGPRVVAVGHHQGDNTSIGIALPVPSVVQPYETPLETLVDLCEGYGLPVSAGDAEGTLLINAVAPGPNPSFGGVRPRGDHKSLVSSLVFQNIDGSLDVAFAFHIDATDLLKDL